MGTFLYYACAVYCTILPALNTIAYQQANPTHNNKASITYFLNYAASNPTYIVQYKSSDMVLHIDSDVSYLSEPRSSSRTGVYYYLRSLTSDPTKNPKISPPENGPIHTECRILRHVVDSSSKAELGGLFHNGKTAVPLRITLNEIGFPQPPTPIKTDNSAAEGVVNATIRQKKFQGNGYAILLYEVQDLKKMFLYWKPGYQNMGYYFTNINHHITINKFGQPIYIWQTPSSNPTIRLCKDGKMP